MYILVSKTLQRILLLSTVYISSQLMNLHLNKTNCCSLELEARKQVKRRNKNKQCRKF